MIAFKTALLSVFVALMYMLPGYLLGKAKKAAAGHLSTMSAVLIYVCSPCMIISSFLSMEFSAEDLRNMGLFFLVSFAFEVAFLLTLYLILRKKFHINKYRMLAIGSTLGNCGFFGMPLIKALLPDHPEVACYSSIFVISMNILVFTAAVYCLTQEKKYISLYSAVINPAVLSLLVALILYIVGAGEYIPATCSNAIDLMGKMTTPVCMLILGIRLSTIRIRELVSEPFVYFICIGKLIVFPLMAFVVAFFLPVPYSFKASLFILGAVPCASVILNMAEIHGKEQKLSANCILLSTLLCIFTIPAMSLLLQLL
ncbi:MAG: AEC family transporter [Clostridiales bacterium]|nr:AEC family transporter [Clostridiales bacterium]